MPEKVGALESRHAPGDLYTRSDLSWGLACFGLSFALYLHTLTPGLLPGDSGEFQTLSYLLGHTHPTGYPVYLVLAKVATTLPLGDVAYRVNLFSAFMAALAVGLVYLTGRLLVKYRPLAFLGALILAVSPTFWSQAVIAEIYSSGAAVLLSVLLLLLTWHLTGKDWHLFIAGLLGGLSLGIHMSNVLCSPAVLIFLGLHWRRGKKMWISAIAGALCGVCLTISLFWLIDLNNPPENYFNAIVEPSRSAWGLEVGEITGRLERLIFGWSARQFRSFMFADFPAAMLSQAAEFWRALPFELSWFVVFLSIAGMVNLLGRDWRVGVFLVISLVIQLFYFYNYQIWDIYVFYIPAYIFITLQGIAGMGFLVDSGKSLSLRFLDAERSPWLTNGLVLAVGIPVILLAIYPLIDPQKGNILSGEIAFEFDEYPRYDDNLEKFVNAVVNSMPVGAILFTEWDLVWPYYYASSVTGDRSDLTFHETYPADDQHGVADSVVDYVRLKAVDQPVFFSEREPSLQDFGFDFMPVRIGPARLFRIIEVNQDQ